VGERDGLFETGLAWSPDNLHSTTFANAYAERFVRTIKEGCLEQVILFGEDSLRKAIREFVAHYHLERNHQGLDNRLIIRSETPGATNGPVRKRQRLGGMLNYYYRTAA
jgi:putative transposase